MTPRVRRRSGLVRFAAAPSVFLRRPDLLPLAPGGKLHLLAGIAGGLLERLGRELVLDLPAPLLGLDLELELVARGLLAGTDHGAIREHVVLAALRLELLGG